MTLVFATRNTNKIKEVQALLPSSIRLLSLDDINCTEELEETTNSIEGNAFQKAEYIKANYGYDCFADDTGLEVDALDGAPGVDSAHYSGERDPEKNIDKLLEKLKNSHNRKARFKTIIALLLGDEQYCFEGICNGQIIHSRQGTKGFGYDPVFQPNGYTQTFAEMSLELKNQIGHRGKAVDALVKFLNRKAVNI